VQIMSLHISQRNEARLTEEAQRQGVSVDALIERLMNERAASPPVSGLTGAALLAVLQASPYRDVDLTPQRYPLPVRDVVL
jgi:hypothetical protein